MNTEVSTKLKINLLKLIYIVKPYYYINAYI